MIKTIRSSIVLYLSCAVMMSSMWAGRASAESNPDQMKMTFYIHVAAKGCQMAIWVENEKGQFVDTVYVTRKTAQKGLGNRGGGLDDKMGGSRLSVLPVWAHHRGVDYGDGNFYPPKDKPLPDAMSSATPKAGEFVWTWHPEKSLSPGTYTYYIEVNKSFDDNEHHNYSWYRGQPSVIWQGIIRVGKRSMKSRSKIIGHGNPTGKDGTIDKDVSTLSTALVLIQKAEAVYSPGVE